MNTRIIQSQKSRWHWEMLAERPAAKPSHAEQYQQLQGFILQLYGNQASTSSMTTRRMITSVPRCFPVHTGTGQLDTLQVWFDGTDRTTHPAKHGRLPRGRHRPEPVRSWLCANRTLATVRTAANTRFKGPVWLFPASRRLGLYLAWGAGVAPAGPVTAEFDYRDANWNGV